MRIRTMVGFLLVSFCAALVVKAAPLPTRRLPASLFRGWVTLDTATTDTGFRQMWRQTVRNLPDGAEGYQMVAYQVQMAPSNFEAEQRAKALLQKQRFSEYNAQGYTVQLDPWAPVGQLGARFSIRGIRNISSSRIQAHHAQVYTLAIVHEEWVVWLEVRSSASGSDITIADRAVRKLDDEAFATDLVREVMRLWRGEGTGDSLRDLTPPDAQAPSLIPTTAAPETPPAVARVPDAVPAPAAPVADMPTTPSASPVGAAPSTPPIVVVPDAPPPVVPAVADGPRWRAEDGRLSLVLPGGWKVAVARKPTIFAGANTTVRLYGQETYSGDAARQELFDAYVATQRDISTDSFSTEAVMIAGVPGVAVHYTNYNHDTLHGVYFGADGLLWRIEVEVPGAQSILPASARQLLESLRIEPASPQ